MASYISSSNSHFHCRSVMGDQNPIWFAVGSLNRLNCLVFSYFLRGGIMRFVVPSLNSSSHETSLNLAGQAPMNSVPSQRDVAESLEIIAQFVSADPARTPSQFVIELAQTWKERG